MAENQVRCKWDQIKGFLTELFSCSKICVRGGGGGSGMQLWYQYQDDFDLNQNPMPMHVINTFTCSQCGEIFHEIESLEFHQVENHSVFELEPGHTNRRIVEIMFKSTWQEPGDPIFEIERVFMVQNTERTIRWYEQHRASVMQRAVERNGTIRCVTDGNEMHMFHTATITCGLGTGGSSSLCSSYPACGICTILRDGFRSRKKGWGIFFTTSSRSADDFLGVGSGTRRAAIVCHVIVGKVKTIVSGDAPDAEMASSGLYDSFADIDEYYVVKPRAIMASFVVIYRVL